MKKKKPFPKIKKEIKAFLTSEEGRITKKSAIDLGIKAAILGSLLPKISKAISSHVSHSQHSSCHASCHDSHAQHSKHNSCVGIWTEIAICR